MDLYLGLVHYPINNKRGEIVTTSVTNLDVHDISRSCRTFGVKKYFIITPLLAQQALIGRLLGHWEQDVSLAYNPDRFEALKYTKIVSSYQEALKDVETEQKQRPVLVVTGANFESNFLEVSEFCQQRKLDNRPVLLLFGTGWGLHASLIQEADEKLAPIKGPKESGYNHLSVRSAVAIYLDRINQAGESIGR